MGYWIAEYEIPLSLAKCWWLPMQRAGFRVVFDQRELGIWNSSKPIPLPDESERYGGEVSSDKHIVDIVLQWKRTDENAECSVFPVRGDGKQIHRILVASGARRCFEGLYGFDWLYIVDETVFGFPIRELLPSDVKFCGINTQRSDLDILSLSSLGGVIKIKDRYTTVWLTTGPAINPLTQQIVWFVAIEFRNAMELLSRRYHVPSKLPIYVMDRLKERGAQLLDTAQVRT